jgi:hypothetical protein
MPTNSYKAQLERELDSLIKRKIGLRKLRPWSFSGDFLDQRRGMEGVQRELAAAERRHAELRHLLGLPEPSPPVRLAPRPEEMAALQRAVTKPRGGAVRIGTPPRQRRLDEVTRAADGTGPYLTRALTGR